MVKTRKSKNYSKHNKRCNSSKKKMLAEEKDRKRKEERDKV